jgi:hypothetical protein
MEMKGYWEMIDIERDVSAVQNYSLNIRLQIYSNINFFNTQDVITK